jgi:hypothetical protein
MSLVLDGSQYGWVSTLSPSISPAYPITISAWVKSTDDTINQSAVHLVNSFYTEQLLIEGAVGGDPVTARANGGSGNEDANTSSGYSADTWHHACVVFENASSRHAYIDGGSKGSDTATATIASLVRLMVGVYYYISFSQYFEGKISGVAIWETNLSDAEVSQLAGGTDPTTIQAGSLYGYWPLYDDRFDDIGSNDLVLSGSPTFDTEDEPALPPSKATTPNPSHQATAVDFSNYTLSWVDGGDADTFDVYIGESAGSLSLVSSAQAGASLVVSVGDRLSKDVTRWYWRIDSTNANGTTTGDEWYFDPLWAPEITSQTNSHPVGYDAQTVLSVTVVGTPTLTYQWKRNGVTISGATSSTYSYFAQDSETYTCEVTNAGGTVESDPITITVVESMYRYNILNLPLDLDRT